MKIKDSIDDKSRKERKKDIALTSREMDVLRSIVQGLTDLEIAERLKISRYTVSGHRKQIISKFKAKNSCQLVYLACRAGII